MKSRRRTRPSSGEAQDDASRKGYQIRTPQKGLLHERNVRFGSKADIAVRLRNFRFTPIADICSAQTNVRFGSLADICAAKRHVRFTPKADMCGALAMSALCQ